MTFKNLFLQQIIFLVQVIVHLFATLRTLLQLYLLSSSIFVDLVALQLFRNVYNVSYLSWGKQIVMSDQVLEMSCLAV